MLAKQAVAFPVAAPPGTPTDRVEILRSAFANVIQDEAFQTEAAKYNIELDLQTGVEIETLVNKIFASAPVVIDRVLSLISSAQE